MEILLQGEGLADIQIIELEAARSHVSDVIAAAARAQGHEGSTEELLVFVEDASEPLDPNAVVPANEPGKPLRLHVHRCRSVTADVTFNGRTVEHRFGPGTTVQTVKRWATGDAGFKMTEADAAEHVLQLTGTTTRPEPDTHIGALTTGGECRVRFDLVPLKRVEG
jgi:hypothetical protein